MKYRSRIFILLAITMIVIGAVSRAMFVEIAEWPSGHHQLTISSDGRDRKVVLYVPPQYDKTKAVPLVVMLHGMGGTAMNAYKETSWSTKGEKETFIVVYPEATRPNPNAAPSLRNNPQAWNDGSGRFHASEEKIDDVAFIGSVLDRITADYNIDPKRIYVTGFSNGASMAFRVGSELTDRVAAIAPNAGACWTDDLKLSGHLSLCYITGTSDKLNPLDGGFPKLAFGGKNQGGQKKPPVQDTIDKWVGALECAGTIMGDTTNAGVRSRHYGPSGHGSEVKFITVESLGHHWAGGTSQAPEFLVGKNTEAINATDVVWEFFVAHPKK